MTKIEITQSIEKLLELNLSGQGIAFFINIKKSFGGDDELFCDFIQSYLTIQKGGLAPLEQKIYSDFTIYFERFCEIQGEKKLLEQMARYAKYFLMLKLEYVDNIDFAKSISVINSFDALDVYPFLMEVLDDFENKRIDEQSLLGMLKMVEDLILRRYQDGEEIDFNALGLQINKMLYSNNTQMFRSA